MGAFALGAPGLSTAALLREFLRDGQARGLSPHTLRWYGDTLGRFARAVPEFPQGPATLREFLASRSCGPQRLHGYYRALRAFCRWAEAEHGWANPMARLRPPRARRTIPRTLELVELLWLQAAARSPREQALFTLLVDTGCRIGEAASLHPQDIRSASLLLSGKTGPREVPCSPDTLRLLARSTRGRSCFPGRRGPLTAQGLYKLFRAMLGRAGLLGPRVGPHTLRHTFARHYIAHGGDPFSLQRILGHTDLGMVRRYVELWSHDISAQHARHTLLRQLPSALQGELIPPLPPRERGGWTEDSVSSAPTFSRPGLGDTPTPTRAKGEQCL